MNKTSTSLILSSALLASSAVAGVPLNGLQGDGGIAFNPVAFTAGTYTDDNPKKLLKFMMKQSKPQQKF